MSTVRECQRRINLKRTARLLRARRERELHQRRTAVDTNDLEHDAQREYNLIDGTRAEQEAAHDDNYRF